MSQYSRLPISIPVPCHEDWNKMSPAEKGKFCGSCQKVVIDFSKQKPKEIIQYFREHKNQKTCGYFDKSQLEYQPLVVPQQLVSKLSYPQQFLIILLCVFGSALFSCSYTHNEEHIAGDIAPDTNCISHDSVSMHPTVKGEPILMIQAEDSTDMLNHSKDSLHHSTVTVKPPTNESPKVVGKIIPPKFREDGKDNL